MSYIDELNYKHFMKNPEKNRTYLYFNFGITYLKSRGDPLQNKIKHYKHLINMIF